ncbi:hypothetical protein, partial [Weissella cibaria]|uniref:hypothetical protein n=1 Tax=Weissella cibaria TaxID=137591 RepID=UPI00215B7383
VPFDGMYVSTFYHWGIIPAVIVVLLITGGIICFQGRNKQFLLGFMLLMVMGFSENMPRIFYLTPLMYFWIIDVRFRRYGEKE